jgi:hypothetical protein
MEQITKLTYIIFHAHWKAVFRGNFELGALVSITVEPELDSPLHQAKSQSVGLRFIENTNVGNNYALTLKRHCGGYTNA